MGISAEKGAEILSGEGTAGEEKEDDKEIVSGTGAGAGEAEGEAEVEAEGEGEGAGARS